MTSSTAAGAGPPGPRPRRFTVADAMTLIAATAAGLALVRYRDLAGPHYFGSEPPAVPGRIVYHSLAKTGRFVYEILPIHFAMCAAVLASFLRGGRPRREALSRSPGAAACFAALFMVPVTMAFRMLDFVAGDNPGVLRWEDPMEIFRQRASLQFGSPEAVEWLLKASGEAAMPAVLAVWTVQRLGGLWNPTPAWDDRIGRALGAILLLWMLTPH